MMLIRHFICAGVCVFIRSFLSEQTFFTMDITNNKVFEIFGQPSRIKYKTQSFVIFVRKSLRRGYMNNSYPIRGQRDL